MSYAGTYGPDETCEHDTYRPSCWKCNGAVERFVQDLPRRVAHAAVVDDGTVTERTVVVYDASCPGCPGRGSFPAAEQAEAWLTDHRASVHEVAADWSSDHPLMLEAQRRGLVN